MKKKQVMRKALEEIAKFKRLRGPHETFNAMRDVAQKALDKIDMGKNAPSPVEPQIQMGSIVKARHIYGVEREGVVIAKIPAEVALNIEQAKLWFPRLFEQSTARIQGVIKAHYEDRYVILCDDRRNPGKNIFAIYPADRVKLA